jgi:biuret amidohydrolase
MERLHPKRTAVLSLDVQNDIAAATPGIEEFGTLDHIARLLDTARRAGLLVMHVTASVRPDYRDIPRRNPLWLMVRKQGMVKIGTPGAELHPSAAALPDELVFNKSCVDPFLTTGLGQALNNYDIEAVVLAGLWTNYVVEATARHASDMGYGVYIVRECCASNKREDHDFAMDRILPMIGYVVSIDEAVAAMG